MKHLLALSIGPVQDFIAAARRTSDLTAGSELLVSIAKATAAAVEAQGGALIFPARLEADGPNKILAELPEGVAPQTVAAKAKEAARDALRKEWDGAKVEIKDKYELNEPLADAQVKRFLELYAAWTPFGDDGYAEARARVDALLAGRKNLRDFAPPPEGVAPKGIYGKSPLDPAFECVLQRIPEDDTGYLRLRKTEFLDAVSLLKRVKGRTENRIVPSTRDLARGYTEQEYKGNWPDEDDLPEAYGYFAVLAADGDQMGARLKTMTTPDQHRAFSDKLAGFAAMAREIVKRHDGYLVYAGGDDVLAFLPVKTAVKCARELADAFRGAVGGTLSAGVAICHYRQPLSLSLEAAREAEGMAKDSGRDSLCLALHARGGQPLIIPQKWAEWETFDRWVSAFQSGALTRGVAYELRKLAREFKCVTVPPDLLHLEARRIWERKQGADKANRPEFPDYAAANVESLGRFADVLVAARFLTRKEDGG